MRAVTFIPNAPGSAALTDVPEPSPADGSILVRTIAVGVCGTDREIVAGEHGDGGAGDKERRLVLGHESVGEVLEAPDGSGFAGGDLVVGIVRRPDPVPCASCAVGEWDMCRNGRYLERGIKGLDGFLSERFRIEPEFAVKVDASLGELAVLLEPASVVAKAWRHIEHIGRRSRFVPKRVLVTGAGPIGLLAALLGVQRGLDIHVLDRAEDGVKPELVRALGATYHTGDVADAGRCSDIVLECTGAPSVIMGVLDVARPAGIVCLLGVSRPGRARADIGAINRDLVLENNVVFGSVNANRGHYDDAARALAGADRAWLQRIITRRLPLARWEDALAKVKDDVKTIVTFTD